MAVSCSATSAREGGDIGDESDHFETHRFDLMWGGLDALDLPSMSSAQ
jgi:hypothetical protein